MHTSPLPFTAVGLALAPPPVTAFHQVRRHLIGLALAAPATTAITVAIALPFLSVSERTPQIVGLMFCFGSLVGYGVELLLFLPLYALVYRRFGVTGWRVMAAGALAGALPSLLLNDRASLFSRDPIELALSPLGLVALGALGGLIYWLFVREPSAAPVPFNGLSGSQP